MLVLCTQHTNIYMSSLRMLYKNCKSSAHFLIVVSKRPLLSVYQSGFCPMTHYRSYTRRLMSRLNYWFTRIACTSRRSVCWNAIIFKVGSFYRWSIMAVIGAYSITKRIEIFNAAELQAWYLISKFSSYVCTLKVVVLRHYFIITDEFGNKQLR